VARFTFSGVDVGLPAKVMGSEAEEEWQEVDWVTWSTGELTIDGDSYLLSFKPSGGAGSVKAKPLGSLIRAGAVATQDQERRTFAVTTSDSLHKLYRFTFQSSRNSSEFERVAALAERAQPSRDVAEAPDIHPVSGSISALEPQIRETFNDRWPLIFGGSELYGYDPKTEHDSSEVLLGRGDAVLLDPPEDSSGRAKVGAYELLFYGEDEGVREPIKRIPIGPRMTLKRRTQEDDDGPAVSFEIAAALQGLGVLTITFDSADTAAAFSRDFRVRQRLMDVASKTAKQRGVAEELRSEIQGLKNQHFITRLWRFACVFVVFFLIAFAVRVAMLHRQDGGARPLLLYLHKVAAEARGLSTLLHARLLAVGSKVCEAAFDSVAAADLRRCTMLAETGQTTVQQLTHCLESLIPV